jgi:GT2 family glycosyltransferase
VRIQLEEIDLMQPWPTLKLQEGYHAIRVLVRIGTTPIGEVMTRPAVSRLVYPRRLRRRIAKKLTPHILKFLSRAAIASGPDAMKSSGMPAPTIAGPSNVRHARTFVRDRVLLETGLPKPYCDWVRLGTGNEQFWMPPVTVAICTRDRPEELERCLENLKSLDYPDYDVLVVDNSRDPGLTRDIADRFGVTYTRQPKAGLSRARNTALKTARAEWVAFTDDDCKPEPNWLRELVRELQDGNCKCVTGLVLPAQLENAAEIAFELYGGLGRGYVPMVFDNLFRTRIRTAPAATWRIGAGANMLLDATFVREFGYDEDLGPGGIGGCGEDTDVFYRLLRSGQTIHYNPRAIVHHHHRSSPEALRKQVYSYAVGHAAYHWRCFWRYRDYRSMIHLLWHLPNWWRRNLKLALKGKTTYPFSLIGLEIRGTFYGPTAYTAVKIRRFGRFVWDVIRGRHKLQMPRLVRSSTLADDYRSEKDGAATVKKPVRAA